MDKDKLLISTSKDNKKKVYKKKKNGDIKLPYSESNLNKEETPNLSVFTFPKEVKLPELDSESESDSDSDESSSIDELEKEMLELGMLNE